MNSLSVGPAMVQQAPGACHSYADQSDTIDGISKKPKCSKDRLPAHAIHVQYLAMQLSHCMLASVPDADQAVKLAMLT